MVTTNFTDSSGLRRCALFILICSWSFSCRELLSTDPIHVTDTAEVTITCDSRLGNRGLLDYSGDVFVHIGLITSKSRSADDWQYVKFAWGSRDHNARATPVAKNRWSYKITNIRQFFNVPADEKIISLAILYRSGSCIDVRCKVLRNADGSNMYISVDDLSAPVKDPGRVAE